MHELKIPVPPELVRGADVVRFCIDGPVSLPQATATVDLACNLIPAMRRGIQLHLSGEPGVDVAAIVSEFSAWRPELSEVQLTSDTDGSVPKPPGDRTALFFTGGVDSFFSLYRHVEEIDALVYVLGYDLQPTQGRLWDATRRALQAVAAATGKDLVVVETNLRAHLDGHASWEVTHGAALAAVAHLLGNTFGRFLASSSFSRDQLIHWGSSRELDRLWSTRRVRISHVGDDTSRLEKLRALGAWDLAMQHLRVCWENPEQAYNCGGCSKCVRTRLALDALGLLDRAATFGGKMSAGDLGSLHHRSRVEAHQLHEVADEYDRTGCNSAPAAALRRWLRDHWGRAELQAAPAGMPASTQASVPAGRKDRLVVEEPRVEVDDAETRLRVDVCRGSKRATFEVSVPLGGRQPSRVGDALLLWFVLPAMRTASGLEIQAPVSEALLERVDRAQRVWADLREYEGHTRVPIVAPARVESEGPPLTDPARPWASAFSCGVDSFHTALRHRERIAFLVTVHGIVQEQIDPEDIRVTGEWLRAGARAAGLPLIEVSMNYREVLVGQLDCGWDYTFVMSKYGLAHLLHPHVGGLLMGGEHSYRDLLSVKPSSKYNPLFDDLTSSNDVRIRLDGLTHSRLEKIREIRENPAMIDALWVCHQRYASDYQGGRNCGRCEKCLRTLTALRLLGASEAEGVFDRPLDVDALGEIRIPRGAYSPSRRMFYRQLLATAEARDDLPGIRAALERVVASFPPADPVMSEMADALVSRHPILSAATAHLLRRRGR